MKCEKCGNEIVNHRNTILCKDCQFKENYSTVNFEEHRYFIKTVKLVLLANKISYERFAEMIGYSADSVKDFMVCRRYSQPLKEAIEAAIENLKNKMPH